MSINKAILKVAQANPEFRKALTAELKKARNTVPPLEMKYYDLGDFGGTQRSLQNWVLEVGGPTWRIKDDLKRAKLRWNPQTKIWELRATLYAAGMMGRPAQNFERIRKMQEVAHKMLKPVIEAENNIIEAENEGVAGPAKKKTIRELVQLVRRDERVRNSLKDNYGVTMEYDFKGRYSPAGTEPQLIFVGDTYSLRNIFKKFGLRWEPSKKGWKIPLMEYETVKKQLLPAVMRELKTASTRTAKIRPETPIQKAVWNAWDHFEGTEKIRDAASYLTVVGRTGLSASTSEAADDEPKIGKLGDQISRSTKAMERQSRSWRTAYNLALEGKIELDPKRLAGDLAKTLKAIRATHFKLTQLMMLVASSTDTAHAPYLKTDVDQALRASDSTITAFLAAIKLAARG